MNKISNKCYDISCGSSNLWVCQSTQSNWTFTVLYFVSFSSFYILVHHFSGYQIFSCISHGLSSCFSCITNVFLFSTKKWGIKSGHIMHIRKAIISLQLYQSRNFPGPSHSHLLIVIRYETHVWYPSFSFAVFPNFLDYFIISPLPFSFAVFLSSKYMLCTPPFHTYRSSIYNSEENTYSCHV